MGFDNLGFLAFSRSVPFEGEEGEKSDDDRFRDEPDASEEVGFVDTIALRGLDFDLFTDRSCPLLKPGVENDGSLLKELAFGESRFCMDNDWTAF